MLARAIAIVSQAFVDKKDKGGYPYILHCLRVMNKIPKDNEMLRCVAVMHDLIEDTNWTYKQLEKCGFSSQIIEILKYVTHKQEDSYEKYIFNMIPTQKEINDAINEEGNHHLSIILNKRDARMVKLADLEDNSDITRLKGLRDKDFERMKKYHKSYLLLKGIKK